jgi:glycerol-3-phosphate acyltransferase
MVPRDRRAARADADALLSRAVFHDGRLVRRPDPAQALFALAYLPVGFLVALLRILFNHLLVPVRWASHAYRLTGVELSVKGTPPPPSRPGSLFVCNRRTALDPAAISAALGRPVTCVSTAVRDGEAALLEEGGDVVVCPEGTTCREPFLLRFSPLFADRVVPVAVDARQGTYYGNTARGCKWLDPCFFYMNPRPGYRVTFLPPLQLRSTGRSAVDVANHVQSVIAKELGFRCTALTSNDKYMKLAGNDGTLKNK